MAKPDKIRSFWRRIREKHKLSFTNNTTYHEKWSVKISALSLITLLAFYTIIVVTLLFLLIRYTPIKEMFSNAPNASSASQIHENSNSIDSLLSKTRSTQLYLNDLQKILTDTPFDDSISVNEDDTTFVNYQPQFYKSTEDSMLRYKVEHQNEASADINYEFFFAPVKGFVSQSFHPKKAHYGIDIVTKKEEPIKSCLEGTVIIAGWTPTEGEVIVIQHNNDLISVYKHCHALLKEQGDKVQTADPIAIVGNSGKYSSGPHLHFEIWKKGIALNPEEFISFKK